VAETGGRKEEHDVLLVLSEDWAATRGEGHVSEKTKYYETNTWLNKTISKKTFWERNESSF
jgi:hypothetical protein